MAKGEFYGKLAWCYEFMTTGKGHKIEADFVRKTVKKYKKSKGNELLDVGCGHGWHDKFLKRHFKVTGVDLNKGILRYAKKRNPEIRYVQGDMRKFDLKTKFDVVLSLDAMMHNLNYDDLERTIKNLAKHLVKGGVLIFHLDRLKENFRPYRVVSDPEGHQFLRGDTHLTYFQIDYDKNPKDTVFETVMVFLIEKRGKDPYVLLDRESMGLFELAKIRKILSKLGFRTYLYSGDSSGKKYSKKSEFPVFVCVKAPNR
jgi:SAM-dependent methyltransferase